MSTKLTRDERRAGLPKGYPALIDYSARAQRLLPLVIRWSKYLNNPDKPIREQNTLQHTFGLSLLGTIFSIRMLSHHPGFDRGLFLTSLLVHDMGEGELGRDVLFHNKKPEDDVREYQAFMKLIADIPTDDRDYLQRAFLLQYAKASNPEFPKQDAAALRELWEENRREVQAFRAIEYWDYIMFCVEQWTELGNHSLLSELLTNHKPALDQLAHDLPGFGAEFWTPEVQAWAVRFMEDHPSEK